MSTKAVIGCLKDEQNQESFRQTKQGKIRKLKLLIMNERRDITADL